MPTYVRGGHGNRNAFLICLAALTAAAVVLAAFLLLDGGKKPKGTAAVSGGFDAAATVGMLDGAQAGPLGAVDTFTYRLNRQITVRKGIADLRFENPVENRQLMKVTIALADGAVVYRSDAIKPFYSIASDALDSTPKKGTYQATATVEVFDRATNERLNATEESVQLTVE